MSNSKRLVVVLSILNLTWSPALFAGDDTVEVSLFDQIMDAVVDIFVPDANVTAIPEPPLTEAGPTVIFIG